MDLPRPPGDPEMKNIIDKLAQFVARNGHEFETMTKTKQKDNPKFSFLFGGEYYNYYMYKVHAEQTIQRQQQSGGGPPSGPAGPRPLMDIPTLPPPSWNQGPPPSGGFDGGGNGPSPWGRPDLPGFGGGPQGPWGPSQGGPSPNMSPGGPNMSPGGPNINSGAPNLGGMGPGLMMDSGMGQGSPGRSMRGVGLLGMAPGPEAMSMGPGNPPGASSQPPPPPNISHLTEQIAPLQAQTDTLKSQISQSESNLSGQWEVLQQTQDSKIKEAVSAAQEEALQDLCSGTSISMEDMDSILQPIIDSCTKDSISAGKQWIFTHATHPSSNNLIARYLCYRVTQDCAPFNTRLHVIYLINDVLHHCVRKNAEELKECLSGVVVAMYCSAASVASHEQMKKLEKLLTLWESKNKFFDNETLEKMRNHANSWEEYKKTVRNEYKVMVDDVIESTSKTYNSYKMQHDQFVSHANKAVEEHERQMKQMKQQVSDIEAQHQEAVRQWQQQQQPSQNSQSARRSRWDRTAAAWDGSSKPRFQPPPGIPVPDVSRPPPGFAPPQYGLLQEEKETIPTLPYFELPAGLMVPLVKLEDNEYKPIDPSLIRMPPPQPPNERLMAAVELFYAPPSHERPRDPEGWEKLGLYEWSREKQAAIRKKSDEIEKGIRDRSPTLSPDRDLSRESTPEQTVPTQEKIIDKKKERKRYRSRSRTRSRTRSNSGSRESTPERRNTPPRSRKKEKRKDRSRSRSRTRSRSRSRGSDYGNLPSFLTKRSPSPSRRRSRSPSAGRGRSPSPVESRRRSLSPPMAGFLMGDSRLDGSNKGHQMLQKMGWKGAGLGSQETGRVDPVEGGDVREKQDQFKGVGINLQDPYENFRKNRAGAFYTRMRDKADERSDKRK